MYVKNILIFYTYLFVYFIHKPVSKIILITTNTIILFLKYFTIVVLIILDHTLHHTADIDDPWQIEAHIDDVEIIGSLGYLIAVMGAFALAERRMNFQELTRGEMYFRKLDMNNS